MKLKLISSIFCLCLFVVSPVVAATTCKGLEKKPCEAKSTCSYVKSFKRKDGVKVRAHCRAIAKSKKKVKDTSSALKKAKSTAQETKSQALK